MAVRVSLDTSFLIDFQRERSSGDGDLWIGCTCLRLGIPVVTASVAHFRRIDGLGVIPYR